MRQGRIPKVESKLTAESTLCHQTDQMPDFTLRNPVYLDTQTAGVEVQGE